MIQNVFSVLFTVRCVHTIDSKHGGGGLHLHVTVSHTDTEIYKR